MARVYVLGAGVVSPAGLNRTATYAGLLTGQSRSRRVERFDAAGFKCKVAVPIDGVVLSSGVVDRHTEFAMLAAHEAIADSQLEPIDLGVRMGVVYATAIGATIRTETSFRERGSCGLPAFQFDGPTELMSTRFGIKGIRLTVTTGCTAGIDALGTAYDAIRCGLLDAALVAASDAPIVPIVHAAFDRIGAISRFTGDPTLASRPFHRDRDGFVLGEGGAALVLISDEAAGRIGARQPLAAIEGWASVSSAFHMTSIRTTGEDIARAIQGAISDARVDHQDIDFLDLHATSTRMNDLSEANAVGATFGRRAPSIPVTAQKSINGHSLGASSLIELANVVSFMHGGTLPPTANLDCLDEECRVGVSDAAIEGDWKRVLKVASGFSGIHSAIVLARA